MSPFHFITFFLCFILLLQSISATKLERILDHKNCSMSYREVVGNVGGVINLRSRVGKEQKVAMELAVQDFYESSCYSMILHLKDSSRNSDRAASAVVRFVKRKQVQVNMGILSPEEAAIISEFNKFTTKVSLAPTANSPQLVPSANLPLFIQMSNDISIHTQCIAAIVGHFRWRKVTTIYEQSSSFSSEAGLIAELSHSLQRVKSSVDNQNVFPPISSLSKPSNFIDTELMKLKNLNNRVFVILKCSVDFAVMFFERAKQMGMMGKGYVWIVSDDISSLLDSLGQNVIANMQGVIGFRSNFVDSSDSFKDFKLRFQKKFRLEFPEEEHSSRPSIYALRAYDATWMIAKAMESSRGKNEPKNLTFENILAVDFDGLSGMISFKYRRLAKSPTFQIVNVIGKSYRGVAMWSPELGLSEKLEGDLGSIYWPGGEQAVPIGWTISINDRLLKIGVPANGAFTQFVKVSYDQNQNETYVAGFSIDVFEAAVKHLPYNFSYVFVPNHGSYDELVVDVANNKSLDAAVGDMEIMADRYKIVTFSQPYMESGLVMVVTVKPGATKERFLFLKAFSMKMWLLMAVMSFSTGFVVWLTENVENNPDFGASSASHHVGRLLWFSVTVLFFVQRESIKSNVSRFVLATWFFVVVVVTACFTANLTSIITVQRLEPSVVDIEYLLRTNAAVGCNGNSFIVKYLINVLHFKSENIKRIRSIKDYPEAFEKREISAAFFVAPHAKVFLAEYCHGYTVVGPSFKLGGFGFVFPKDSPLAKDMSEAILKVTESGQILELEKRMLRFSSCLTSKTSVSDDPSLGPEPFSGLFIVSSCVSAFAFFISVVRILTMQPLILSCMQNKLVNRRIGRWTSSFLRRNNTKSGFPFSEEGETNNPNNFVVARQSSISMELAHNQT